jgi:hypothetical protein
MRPSTERKIMTEPTVPNITSMPEVPQPSPKKSFNWKKIAKRVAIATGVIATATLITSGVKKFRQEDSDTFVPSADAETIVEV